MALYDNTRKSFQFAVDVDGIEQLSIQKITGLSIETDAVAHGEGNSDVFTPGRKKYGDIVMERIKTSGTADNTLWTLIQRSGLGLASDTKRTITIRQLDPNLQTTIGTWVAYGAWVQKVELGELSRTSTDNVMETITWKIDKLEILV
jgi:phage tail-like protein